MTYSMSGLGAAKTPTIKHTPVPGSTGLEDYIKALQNHPRVKPLLEADVEFDPGAFAAVMRKGAELLKQAKGAVRELGIPVPISQREAASTVQGVLAKVKADLRQVRGFEVSANRNDPRGRELHEYLVQIDLNLLSKLEEFINELKEDKNDGTSGLGIFFLGPWPFIIPALVLVGLWSLFEESDKEARKAANEYCKSREGGCTPKEYEEYFRAAGGESSVDKILRYGKDVVDDKVPDAKDITKGAGEGVKWGIIIASVGVVGALAYMAWPYMTGARQVGERFTTEEE